MPGQASQAIITTMKMIFKYKSFQLTPAKFMLAPVASHMRATAVFFDANLTLGTVLSVNEQIIPRLGVVLALDVPVANGRARVRSVIGQRAQEAVLILTVGAEHTSSRRLALYPDNMVALLARCLCGLRGRAATAAVANVRRCSGGNGCDRRARALGYGGN